MLSVVVSFCVSFVVGVTSTASPALQSLSPNLWTVQNQNLSIKVAATVPGGIYTDLRNAGVLAEDIFYRFNDVEYRWVAHDNWTYFATFDVNSKVLKKKTIVLEFEGLDTVAKVVLNSNLLGNTNNMFVLYQFDVKSILKEKNNKLEVYFTSPILAAQQATDAVPYAIPPECNPHEYHGECHINYLRKMQASFAWDWGPAFPSVGIWKDVLLRAYDVAFARYLTTETRPDTKVWKVSATLFLDVKKHVTGTLSASLFLNNTEQITYDRQVSISPQHNSTSLVFSVSKDKVQLWWPNGHGNQPLYNLTVAFKSNTEVTQKTVKIGFRTIKLVQIDAVPNQPNKGLTFYFRVNGVSIFAKGSNYIPAHILPELGTEHTRLRRILTSARDANMNMLRIWGGGLYEFDTFYEMCDEMGIMIWQDMMFACAMYPATEEFLRNVALEVTQAVLRLQHHVSIAVWAGNNENEAALAQNWYSTQANFSLFKADYVKLYVDTIRPIVLRLDKTRSYAVSSPSNGLESEYHGYVASNPYSALYGDLHAYDYVSNLWNSAYIPKTRFSSEYGIMSLPSIESLAQVSLPEDLYLNSEFMSARQHHVAGYIQMIAEIKHNLYLPESYDLDTFIYLSQINQAMSMKTETECYRRGRSELNAAGEGLTMGALYWQLNDVWQAPSWSSMEFSGKWKMLHYFAADFFSPVLVSPNVDITKELRVYVISDLQPHTSLDLIVQVQVYNWKSFAPVYKQKYPSTVTGASVSEVASWNLDDLLKSIDGCMSESIPQKNCFLYFSLLNNNGSTSIGPDNFYFPEPLKSVNGPENANIKVEDVRLLKNSMELIVTLSSDAIAPFVWLDSSAVSGHFSHNGFLLVTEQTHLIFSSEDSIDLDIFKKSLKIKSLPFK